MRMRVDEALLDELAEGFADGAAASLERVRQLETSRKGSPGLILPCRIAWRSCDRT